MADLEHSGEFQPRVWYSKNRAEYTQDWHALPTPELDKISADLPPAARVLDVAFGTGRDLKRFAEHGHHVYGVDIADGLSGNVSAPVAQASFFALPFREQIFDAVWAFAAVIHTPEEELCAAVREFRRVLVPGGKLFINAKTEDDLDDSGFDRHGRWFQLWEPQKFLDAVTRENMTVREFRPSVQDGVRRQVRWTQLLAAR